MSCFVNLCNIDDASMLNGLSKPEHIINKAKELGQKSVGITNLGNINSWIPFYKSAKKNDIKPILGAKVHIVENVDIARNEKKKQFYTITLFAKNKIGYHNLIKLITESNKNYYYKPRIDFEVLKNHSEGLICLSGYHRSPIASHLYRQDDRDPNIPLARVWIRRLRDIFSPSFFFLEVQDHKLTENQEVNRVSRELAAKFNLQCVATNDAYYVEKDDGVFHDALKSIGAVRYLADAKLRTHEYYLKSEPELIDLDLQKTEIENTYLIADLCNVELEFGKYFLPKFDESQNSIQLLRQFLRKGWDSAKLTDEQRANQVYKDRIKKELTAIENAGLADYFLIVQDIIRFVKQNGWRAGVGRGSVGGSLLAYILDITEIDPIKYNTIFERFWNPGRTGSLPDIDMDVEKRHREEVIGYIKNRYGSDKVAQVATYNEMSARSVLKKVFKIANIPFDEANKITACVPAKNEDHTAISLDQALEASPALKKFEEKYKSLFATARKLEHTYESLGTHAAAVIISNEPFSAGNVPLCKAPKGEDLICAWDMSAAESVGMLKMDVLGLNTLDIIEITREKIKEHYDIDLDLSNIPEHDSKTVELFADGRTEGVFQLKKQLGKAWCKKLRPETIEDLSDVVSLIRPGPLENNFTEQYRAVKFGEQEFKTLHESITDIVAPTFGIICYQEQIIAIASRLAGFDLKEADALRSVVGKKKVDEVQQWRDRFISGCVENNIKHEDADHIFEQISKFAGYGFCRAHGVGYSVLSYWTAYLKANYPIEFYLANLTTAKDQEEIYRLINDAKMEGIFVRCPSLRIGNVDFDSRENSIIFGLSQIKNVGKSIDKVLKLKDIEDFSIFISMIGKINSQVITALIGSGALDYFNLDRAFMLSTYDTLNQLTESEFNLYLYSGQSLIDFLKDISNEDNVEQNKIKYKEITKRIPDSRRRTALRELLFSFSKSDLIDSPLNRLGMEKFYLGTTLSGHEADFYARLGQAKHKCINIVKISSGTRISTCLLIESVKEITTKKSPQRQMAFLTGSDSTGMIDNIVVFPDLFDETKHFLREGSVLNIFGTISSTGSLICNKLEIAQ